MDYIDTSALIKGYLIEPHTEAFMTWFVNTAVPCISPLSIVEFKCAIRRRERSGEFPAKRTVAILARFNQHLANATIEQLAWPPNTFATGSDILDRVAPLALRTLDTLHLSLAFHYRCRSFATADRVQAEAAQKLGLNTQLFLNSK